tara:strand:- start:79 stop:405 length:327 start_codon:yes stop_codon:yes gene_type:complete
MTLPTLAEGRTLASEVESADLPVLVYFFDPECRYCRHTLDPIVNELAHLVQDVLVFRVNGLERKDLLDMFGFTLLPAFVLFSENGEEVGCFQGKITATELSDLIITTG